MNLNIGRVRVKLMIDGITSLAFSAETLPPLPWPADSPRSG
jgi:hypothetical protein